MTGTTKLSVEKALNKIREADAQKAKTTLVDDKMAALEEEIRRLRAQRLRLERQRRPTTKIG